MNGLQFLNSPCLYLEIGPETLKALNGDRGLELPLERAADGRLTEACRASVMLALQNLAPRKNWQPRARAFCAIGARGVSLRRLTLPAAPREELRRLLLMQIEAEFPLPPDQLAWGWRVIGESRINGVARQELLVVAVRKEVVEEYSELLLRSGLSPVFTLAALARSGPCAHRADACAVLEVGSKNSEWISFDGGAPTSVRALSWGEENQDSGETLDALARSLNGGATRRKLFLSGRAAGVRDKLAARLAGVDCEALTTPLGEGRSAAIHGLKQAIERNGGELLLLEMKPANGQSALSRPAPRKWALAAVALVVGALLLPYAEAILLKPVVTRELTALNASTNRLDVLDHELEFLQSLKQSQPPYLDAMYLFAKFAPQGARVESLIMNRRGEVSMRGSLRNADQVAEFRSKLIDSGFFSGVAVEEQTPTPDRQKVNVRISAQWKPSNQLRTLAIGPTADEIEKAKTRKDAPGGMPGGMPMGMPMGMPAGISFGGGMPPGAMPVGAMPEGMPPAAARSRPRPAGAPSGAPPGMDLPPGVELSPGSSPPVIRGAPRMEGNQ